MDAYFHHVIKTNNGNWNPFPTIMTFLIAIQIFSHNSQNCYANIELTEKVTMARYELRTARQLAIMIFFHKLEGKCPNCKI